MSVLDYGTMNRLANGTFRVKRAVATVVTLVVLNVRVSFSFTEIPRQMKTLPLAAFCASLLAACFPGTAYASDAIIYECNQQLLQKYPNMEAIKSQFGSGAEWQESTMSSMHDASLELLITEMEYPGISIIAVGYTLEGEDRHFIVKLHTQKMGIVDFLGVDVGAAREEVIKTFGEPQEIDGNELIFHDEATYTYIIFAIENNTVVEMKFNVYLDG